MCIQNKQRPWVLVHHTLFGETKETVYDSHTKASNALYWVLKSIKENYLDGEAYIKPYDNSRI